MGMTMLLRSAQAWFVVAAVGQVIFAAYILRFYWVSTLQGEVDGWGKVLPHGWTPGDLAGNLTLAAHVLLALVITLGGVTQVVTGSRGWARAWHRWNGRLFALVAFVMSAGGLYLIQTRGAAAGQFIAIGNLINATLIGVAVVQTIRHGRARLMREHERWAMRTFLLVSGVWFIRLGFGFWVLVNQGAPGHTKDFSGPFDLFLGFGHTLLPMAIYEVYWRVRDGGSTVARVWMTGALGVLTLATGVGIVGATMIFWLPRMRG